MRTHTGDRPFACNICDKKYVLNSLNTHLTHTMLFFFIDLLSLATWRCIGLFIRAKSNSSAQIVKKLLRRSYSYAPIGASTPANDLFPKLRALNAARNAQTMGNWKYTCDSTLANDLSFVQHAIVVFWCIRICSYTFERIPARNHTNVQHAQRALAARQCFRNTRGFIRARNVMRAVIVINDSHSLVDVILINEFMRSNKE